MDYGYLSRIRRYFLGYTLAEIYEEWSALKYPMISKGAVNSYEIAWNQCSKLHNEIFKDIKFKDWQSVISDLHDKGLHYSSQKKFKNLCGQLCEYAIENELATSNYAPMLKLDRNKPIFKKQPFTEAEIRKLWTYEQRITGLDLILILIYTGLRVGEFLRVNMENDVFLEDRFFIVRESKTEAGRNRTVPIHKDLIPFFRYRKKYEFLSTTRKGVRFKSYTRFRMFFSDAMEKLGMNHTIHETRHTCATLLDSAEANDMAIKRILGHAGQGVTKKVYIHKAVEDLLKAIDLVKGRDI